MPSCHHEMADFLVMFVFVGSENATKINTRAQDGQRLNKLRSLSPKLELVHRLPPAASTSTLTPTRKRAEIHAD